MSEKILIEKEIIPKTMYYHSKIHDIFYVDPRLIIKKYEILLNDKSEVESLNLFNPHPNCNLKTNEFCLPDYAIGKELKDVQDYIDYTLSVYNLENSWWQPWGLIKYNERQKGETNEIIN